MSHRRSDQVLESFRRSKLFIFLLDVIKHLGHSVKLEQTNILTVHLVDKKDKKYSSTSDSLLRPELQEMFTISEKVGYARRARIGSGSSSEQVYLMILTDMGLLLLDTSKFEFKGFIPVLGAKLRTNKDAKNESKGEVTYLLEIAVPNCQDKDVVYFSSQFDKQEWVTKILKIRDRSISI